jgi:hypothetical protein
MYRINVLITPRNVENKCIDNPEECREDIEEDVYPRGM